MTIDVLGLINKNSIQFTHSNMQITIGMIIEILFLKSFTYSSYYKSMFNMNHAYLNIERVQLVSFYF
jgi:hypothetical protein